VKLVLVTGANSGLGKEVAFEFARRGAKVIMVSNDITHAYAQSQMDH